MIIISRLAGLLLAFALAACASTPPNGPAPKAQRTVLISIDGFRADYLDRGVTPTLSALAADGVRGGMRPSFPSLTFPNHYTLVTGKRPDHNGIVDNSMEDEAMPDVTFSMSKIQIASDPRWWSQAAPIWVTAQRQGVPVGTMFWPGSDYEIDGVRPTRWKLFDQKMASNDRVDTLLSWFDEPGGHDLRLTTLYFDVVDTEGHHHGPGSPQTDDAIRQVDAAIARLIDGLKARGLYQTTNMVIVADHGMAAQPLAKTVQIDTVFDKTRYRPIGSGSVFGVKSLKGPDGKLYAVPTHPHPNLTCWEKSALPARFGYGTNPRVAPVVCLADLGWYFPTAKNIKDRVEEGRPDGGAHGYDPADPNMRAIFVAHGPAFKSGVVLPVFDNVDVYPLLTRVIGVKGERGDGSLARVKPALR